MLTINQIIDAPVWEDGLEKKENVRKQQSNLLLLTPSLVQLLCYSLNTFFLRECNSLSLLLSGQALYLFFLGAGFGMIQVDEYLVAAVCWLTAAIVSWSKAIHWRGVDTRPGLTKLGRIVWILGTIAFLVLLYSWTEIKRGDQAWSAFFGPKKLRE